MYRNLIGEIFNNRINYIHNIIDYKLNQNNSWINTKKKKKIMLNFI